MVRARKYLCMIGALDCTRYMLTQLTKLIDALVAAGLPADQMTECLDRGNLKGMHYGLPSGAYLSVQCGTFNYADFSGHTPLFECAMMFGKDFVRTKACKPLSERTLRFFDGNGPIMAFADIDAIVEFALSKA